jgi:hypothetical protein
VLALDVSGDGSAIVLWTQTDLLMSSRYVPGAGWGGACAIAAYPSASWPSVNGFGLDNAGRAVALFSSMGGRWSAGYDPASGWTAAAQLSGLWGNGAFSMAPAGDAAFAWSGVDAASDPGGQYTYAWLRAYAPGTGWGSPVAVGALGHLSSSVYVQTLRLATGETLVSWTDLSQIFVNVLP